MGLGYEWRVVTKIYEETVYRNKYDDGRTWIKVLKYWKIDRVVSVSLC